MSSASSFPRHDFYQTDTHVIVAVYLKGYAAPELAKQVNVSFENRAVEISLPASATADAQIVRFEPLHGTISPDQSSSRVLSTKIEMKLAKTTPTGWPALLGHGQEPDRSSSQQTAASSTSGTSAKPGPSSSPLGEIGLACGSAKAGGPEKVKAMRPNWDKLVETELEEQTDVSDPNAGGEKALQDMFAKIYAGADEDTKRAMIKSFTESGGTTLSTDWSTIGKETTPVRPPDGMYEMKM